jgi:hypothetical protein
MNKLFDFRAFKASQGEYRLVYILKPVYKIFILSLGCINGTKCIMFIIIMKPDEAIPVTVLSTKICLMLSSTLLKFLYKDANV